MKKRYLLLGLSLLFFHGIGRSQEDGGYPGAFLRMGIGARAIGMGQAYTAISDDASGTYWNPAGLGGLKMMELMGAYTILSMERQHNYVAFVYPSKSLGTFGLSWINLGVGSIEGRDMFGRVTNTFTNNENAIALSWGIPIIQSLYFGTTAKFLTHQLENNHSSGFGFDAGILYKVADILNIGVSMRNISTAVTWDTQSKTLEKYPMEGRIGAAYYHEQFPLVVGLDYVIRQNQAGSFHVGSELGLGSFFGVRLGMDNGHFALGGSITVPMSQFGFKTDYCLARDPIDLTYVHRFTLQLKFSHNQSYTASSGREYGVRSSDYYKTMTPLPEARIIKTLVTYPNFALVNIGSDDGIEKGSVFEVHRLQYQDGKSGNGKRIKVGTVEVVRIKETASAVRVITMNKGYSLQQGDFLVKTKKK